jgi:hypothetical protein
MKIMERISSSLCTGNLLATRVEKILCSTHQYFLYFIQHCFICRPSDFPVSEDGVIEPEAEFLDVIGTKEFSSLLFTVTSSTCTDFNPLPHFSKIGWKLVCNVNIIF